MIDHLDVNLKDRVVYTAALGNNTLEAIDLTTGKIIHTIKDLDEPQGIGCIPQSREIVVANGGNGDCYFYNARTFEKLATIHLAADADDVRYDSANKKIYIGYGHGEYRRDRCNYATGDQAILNYPRTPNLFS